MHTTTSIAIALLAPFWWAMGQMALALLGDLSPRCRGSVSRLLDRLEGARRRPAMSNRQVHAGVSPTR